MRAMLMERIVLSNKVEKKAGPITKAAEASCVQRPAKRALADAKPLGFFLALAELIASG
jgi:hypothetical protein